MNKILQDALSEKLDSEIVISSSYPVGGGCINKCSAIQTNQGKFFVKQNSAVKFPFMLHAEARGLQLVRGVIPELIPEVIADFEFNNTQYLILEFIEKKKPASNYWSDLAGKLASMHQNTTGKFGLEFDNYMGSLQQRNTMENNWIDFFILHRIQPQLQIAIDKKELPESIIKKFDKLFGNLGNIFPVEKPALIHGDLWSGNAMVGPDGLAKIVDPAVYYGHREADLAMTKLFGGFDLEFYSEYDREFPLESEFDKREGVYNLYPLLIHVNLFGGSYSRQVNEIINRF